MIVSHRLIAQPRHHREPEEAIAVGQQSVPLRLEAPHELLVALDLLQRQGIGRMAQHPQQQIELSVQCVQEIHQRGPLNYRADLRSPHGVRVTNHQRYDERCDQRNIDLSINGWLIFYLIVLHGAGLRPLQLLPVGIDQGPQERLTNDRPQNLGHPADRLHGVTEQVVCGQLLERVDIVLVLSSLGTAHKCFPQPVIFRHFLSKPAGECGVCLR